MLAAPALLVALVFNPYANVIKVFDKPGQTPKITVLPQLYFSTSLITSV
jgi:hypothetical protein